MNTKFPSPLFPRGEGETEYERPYLPPSLSPHVASSRRGASAVTFVSGESHSHRSGKRKEHTSELWESVAICYSQEPTVPSNTGRRHNFLYGNLTTLLETRGLVKEMGYLFVKVSLLKICFYPANHHRNSYLNSQFFLQLQF